jgi:UDP-N-acetylmuramoylalanine--D-glutamate ligase
MFEKIGILGFGIVGKSVLDFLKSYYPNVQIGVWDQRKLEPSEIEIINFGGAKFFEASFPVKSFFDSHDQIVVSPGVNLRKLFDSADFEKYKTKCIGELDFFAQHFKKQSIAITGTLGKTTVTKLLGQLTNKTVFNANGFENVATGGNIGDAMLHLIKKQHELDLAVLELSSFQLDLNKKFAPDVAIWTNFYPNHLDWHPDMQDYLLAKFKIFEYQKQNQYSIFPESLFLQDDFVKKLKNLESQICIICESIDNGFAFLKNTGIQKCFIFGQQNNKFCVWSLENEKIKDSVQLFDLNFLPDVSFIENWFLVLAALHCLKFDLKVLEDYFQEKDLFLAEEKFCEHRVELFTTINGVDFYNDSKSTIVQATQAAIKKLEKNGKPIILILGGLGKGVDRSSFFKSVSDSKNFKKVFFFGKPSKEFESFHIYSSLQDVLHDIFQIAKPGDQVLFSPSGTSFDFFKDYEHRGTAFKELVLSSK